MNRREMLSSIGFLPLAAGVAAFAGTMVPPTVAAGTITRVSCEEGDPGEIARGMLFADGKVPKVFLDGVYQPFVRTADVSEGMVKRFVVTQKGNIAINPARNVALTEVVYGRVEIRIVDKGPPDAYRNYHRGGDSAPHAEVDTTF